MSALPSDESQLVARAPPAGAGVLGEASGSIPTRIDADGTGERRSVGRSVSGSSTQVDPATGTPSRSNTLKKSGSIRKRATLSRRNSRRSLRAGLVRGTGTGDEDDEGYNNIFNTPIPTHGNPTDVLSNRFQAWRKLLKDLITYFREIQSSYEHRSKALLKVSNVVNNTHTPNGFLSQAGLDEAITTLRSFHKISVTEANKSKDIEEDVITQLNGLRNDLNQKIKEIKSLAGDFKNSVDKEKEATRKAVEHLKDVLAASEADPASASGKNDPFIVRLAVERQVERQIEEENYLHRAYLNLEGSGRELETIVIGEIQKAYNAYAGILRREADHAQQTIEDLRSGPIAMPKDHEWIHFVEHDDHFVNPNIPLRRIEDVYFAGKFSAAASEIRGGLLERKSKYLKSYTPGWYVLSPTHLHEFKSADHIQTQQPVMSLYLLDQRLGSHSQPGASSHKFSFKGKQAGSMHRGHSWVFRAESYETMMAWFEDIRILTEKTGPERIAFVRRHARSVSGGSNQAAPSVSSDGLDEDEADAEPYSANSVVQQSAFIPPPQRPEPGGRFPSELYMNHTLNPSSSGSSEIRDESAIDGNATGVHKQQHDGQPSVAVAPVVAYDALEPAPASRQVPSPLPSPAAPVQREGQPASSESDAHNSQSTPLAYEMHATQSSPVQSSALRNDGPGDATNDQGAPVAAVGGALGGTTAALLVQGRYDGIHAQYGDGDDKTPTQPSTDADFASQTTQPHASYFDSNTSSTQTQQQAMTPQAREATLPNLHSAPSPASHDSLSTPTTQTGLPLTDASSIATDDTAETTTPTKAPQLHRTGHMFPSVLRHDTSASVSELHVPGEFPPPTPVELE